MKHHYADFVLRDLLQFKRRANRQLRNSITFSPSFGVTVKFSHANAAESAVEP